MRSLLLPILLLSAGLLTTCASAQDDSFLIQNPANFDSGPDAYYATPVEPAQTTAPAAEQRAPESSMIAIAPPVDLITREASNGSQPVAVHVRPAQATVMVKNQTLPTFANDLQQNSDANHAAMIRVAQRSTSWPAQASPFPVNPAQLPTGYASQSPPQPVSMPVVKSAADEYYATADQYYVPTMPVAATTTVPASRNHAHHRPIQQDACHAPSQGTAAKYCDEWKDFWPCKRIDYGCSCRGSFWGFDDNCGCHANCPGGCKGKHQGKACGASYGADKGSRCAPGCQDCQCESCRGKHHRGKPSTCNCEQASGGEFNPGQSDESRESPPRRFSVFTININR